MALTASSGSWLNRALAEANMGNNYAILQELTADLADPMVESELVHEAIFRGCTETAPTRRATGFLHACAWGNINAGTLNPAWALLHVFATDVAIGRYIAKMIVACMKRVHYLSDKQTRLLRGLSMTKVAATLRSGAWGELDIPNDVFGVISTRLAECGGGDAPPATRSALVYADPTDNARVPVVIGALMEAFGMQSKGDGSLRSAFEEANAGLAGNSHFPPQALADLLKANQKYWKALLQETCDHYHPTRTGANLKAELPLQNVRSGAASGPKQDYDLLFDNYLEASALVGLQNKMAGSASSVGGAAVQAALLLLSGKPAGEKQQRHEKGRADKDADDAQRKDFAEKQKRADAERLQRYESAGAGEMTGTADAAVFRFGQSSWNATEAAKAWPGKCVPWHCAESCGKGLGAKACPEHDHPDHVAGGAAHTLDEGMPRPSKFNLRDASRKRPLDSKGGSGKGKGGRGKGKGGRGKVQRGGGRGGRK